MTTSAFPITIDIFASKADGVDRVLADHINYPQSAITAIENLVKGQISVGPGLALLFDNGASGNQALFIAANKSGLAAGNPNQGISLTSATVAELNDTAHDYNLALLVQNYTADGAGISAGNAARGDAIYAQCTDASGFIGPANAVNVYPGGLSIFPSDSGSGGTVTYTATTVTDTSKNWTVNTWVGRYVVIGNFGLTAKVLYVTSNTATVLTGTAGWMTQVGASQGAFQTGAATPVAGTAYLIPKSNATGINVGRFSTGNGLRVTAAIGTGIVSASDYPGSTSGADYLVLVTNASVSTSLGLQDNGATTADTAVFSSGSKTSGNLLQFYHNLSTMTGDGIFGRFADGSGTFTGNFLRFQVNAVTKFLVTSAGLVQVAVAGGLDTIAAGALAIGASIATAINLGAAGKQLQLTASSGAVVIQAGGLTVTAGGLTVTAGGLTVSASGITVTGASSIGGALTISGANNLIFSTNNQGVTNSGGNLNLNAAGGSIVYFSVNAVTQGWIGTSGFQVSAGLAYDTTGAGALNIGNTNATSIVLGSASARTAIPIGPNFNFALTAAGTGAAPTLPANTPTGATGGALKYIPVQVQGTTTWLLAAQ